MMLYRNNGGCWYCAGQDHPGDPLRMFDGDPVGKPRRGHYREVETAGLLHAACAVVLLRVLDLHRRFLLSEIDSETAGVR